MRRLGTISRGVAAAAALALVAAACGSDSKSSSDTTAAGAATTAAPAGSTATGSSEAPEITTGVLKPVKLQLQWFTQAQFAGYFAALEKGFYRDEGLDVQILEGGVDIVPQTVLAQGNADFAIAWVPKELQSREQGAGITDIAQIFQRSGTLQVSKKPDTVTDPAGLKGKKVGNWGFGNEFELFAGMTKAGLNPASDVTLVQQQFDMQALLKGEIDAAQAMIYNEYAQVLEAKNPTTGKLYAPEDLNLVDFNDPSVGTAMLQDQIFATDKWLKTGNNADIAAKFLQATFKGWIYCRDNAQKCVDIVLAKGSQLGASHQAWQMNEINALIWPSPKGIGLLDKALYDQTISIATTYKVLKAAPSADATRTDLAQKALDALGTSVDTKGASFAKQTVTLKEGGN